MTAFVFFIFKSAGEWEGWFEGDLWFSPGVPILSTNKTYQRDITEVLLYVALNNIAIYLIHLI